MTTSSYSIALAALACAFVCASCSTDTAAVAEVQPAARTQPVPDDPDDPAVWVHPTEPARSLIIGTNKVKAPGGALIVFGLDGAIRQTVAGLNRPNNVDVEYGLRLAGERFDIAVATERLERRLRIYRIAPDGSGISDVTSIGNTQVFTSRTGEGAEPMGISLYQRPADGVIFAIVAPKTGPADGYLGQYRLEDDGQGKVKASFVRFFGKFSGTGEIEAVAVDDELGYVYYGDEGGGIRKYHADPDTADASHELAFFGRQGFRADREGIAIYALDEGTGYVVCTDQVAGNSEYHIYPREGRSGKPHEHEPVLKVVRGGADSTDGLEITSRSLGPNFPAGMMVAMNSGPRNFLIYRWEEIARVGQVRLKTAR